MSPSRDWGPGSPRPVLLVDQAVIDGSAAALPLSWLDGFELRPYPARRLAEAPLAELADADALLVRSMTRVGAQELQRLPRLAALATLSSGLDHLDVDLLAQRGVRVCSGHGGNARAVADWVDWAAQRLLGDLHGRKALVVGAGAVGTEVVARLQQRGARVWTCDPPRARREPGFVSSDLAVVPPCELVTLHVPLSDGADATRNLWNHQQMTRHPGAVLLQASRGGVLHEEAAQQARELGLLAGLAVDTWVGEPAISPILLGHTELATPHIAGHSIAGKLDVARRAMQQLRSRFGLEGELNFGAAVAQEEARHGGEPFLAIADQLDRVAQALRRSPEAFEQLRHRHKRTQS